jgi:hypothetical protein
VVLIGSPKGLDLTVSDGVISAIRDSGEGYRLFQTSAAASPGSSGGGMFNEAGQLVGILSAKLTTGENLNFGIPVNYVRGLLSATSRTMTLTEFAATYPVPPRASSGTQGNSATPSKAEAANIEALVKLLDASGLRYTKNAEKSWVVSYKGDSLDAVDVYVSLYGNLVLANSLVASKPVLTPDHLRTILQKNFQLDLVKIGLDTANNLAVLTEAELRLLDGPALKSLVEGVAAAADEAAGIVTSATFETAPALNLPNNRRTLRPLSLLQGHAGVRYDPSQWKSQAINEAGAFQFQNAAGDVYIKVINERIEIPLESMIEIVLGNAQKVDPKATVTRRGWRNVNGSRMLLVEIEAIASGIPLTFYYHCFSGSAGTIQLIGFTGRSLMKEARPAIEQFVSGFEVVGKWSAFARTSDDVGQL